MVKLGKPTIDTRHVSRYNDSWVLRSARELLTDVIIGGTPSTSVDEYWDGGIPWISSTEIHQRRVSRHTRFISEVGLANSSAQIAPAGSVLVALAGQGKTRGTSAFLTRDMALNQSLAGLVVSESELHNGYLLYMLKQRYEELRELSSGDGGRGGLNKTLLWNLWFMLPSSIEEQRAIARVLSAFDEHLANLDELIAKKKAIRDGALDDLISGRQRIQGFQSEWRQVKFLNEIAPKARIGWHGLTTDEYLSSGHSYLISGTDFDHGVISTDEISFVDESRYEMDPYIQVDAGDVLVTKDGTIGKVAVVPPLNKPATLNSGVFVLRPKASLRRGFLYWVLMSHVFTRFITSLAAGSTIKHLYQKDLKAFSFYAPNDLEEQKCIEKILFKMDDEIRLLVKERAKVERLKLGAMDDLLTGRVRLPLDEEMV